MPELAVPDLFSAKICPAVVVPRRPDLPCFAKFTIASSPTRPVIACRSLRQSQRRWSMLALHRVESLHLSRSIPCVDRALPSRPRLRSWAGEPNT